MSVKLHRKSWVTIKEEHGVLCAVIHVWGVISKMIPLDFWGTGHRMGHGGSPPHR